MRAAVRDMRDILVEESLGGGLSCIWHQDLSHRVSPCLVSFKSIEPCQTPAQNSPNTSCHDLLYDSLVELGSLALKWNYMQSLNFKAMSERRVHP
jgi:hypothetical protein